MEIPDEQLYRIIVVPKGKWQGEYKIYWNRYIAEKMGIQNILNWLNDDIRNYHPLQYIESMDGTCVPILAMSRYEDKSREFYFCYFPNAMTYFYRRKDHTNFVKRNFYGNFISSRHSLSKSNTITNSVRKKFFVSYIISGMNPVTAYAKAFNQIYHPSLASKVLKLMDDKIVKQELKVIVNDFNRKVNATFTEDDLINELKTLITHCKKGTNTHRENLKFILEITGKYNPNLKQPIDTDYEELPPGDT
jgi:hypothetical protein